MDNKNIAECGELIEAAQRILIIQADNPDADSLASALALEQIFHDMGKEPFLYCGVDMPKYLYYLSGADRVEKQLPNTYDVAVLVDSSTVTLLEQLEKNNMIGRLSQKPFIVIDHHDSEINLPFKSVPLVDIHAVATGEVIFEVANQLHWTRNKVANNMLASSLMADSLGLISEGTTATSIRVLADLVESGVSLAALDAKRREYMMKPKEIIAYKGALLQRIEYLLDGRLALITIPWDEIEKYSPLYNPSMLALEELRMAEGVKVSVALKVYPDGKITGKIRCNHLTGIAADLGGHFGGGGHSYAAGFKTNDWPFDELKAELVKTTQQLLEQS